MREAIHSLGAGEICCTHRPALKSPWRGTCYGQTRV